MNILICEEERILAEIVSKILHKKGHIIYMAKNSKEAISTLKTRKVDVLITDYHLAVEHDNYFVNFSKQVQPKLKIIILSSLTTNYEKRLIEEMQACHFISKPFTKDQLEETLEMIRTKAA